MGSEQFLDAIIEHLPAMIFVKDAKDLRFERFNKAGEELLGLSRDRLLGKTDFDLFPKEQAEFFVAKDRKVLEERRLVDIPEEPIKTPLGTRWLHTRKIPILGENGEPTHLLGMSIEITDRKNAEAVFRASHDELERRVTERTASLELEIAERKRAEASLKEREEELRQAAKMEAIGRLAGGIAHDFNNLLTAILTYAEFLKERIPADDPRHRDAEEIGKAGRRAADLTRKLLAFSRQQVLDQEVLDTNEIVRSMEEMIRRFLGERIRLSVSTEATKRVKADRGQLEQVILNLAINARDAMPAGGELHVQTSDHAGPGGSHVLITVRDTGTGMDETTRARIFEPFFTTKDRGKGTGLGLATVFGIVQQSGGVVRVESEVGRGSTFRVLLPVTEESAIAPPEPERVAASRRGELETVLLVEDEEAVRRVTATILLRAGYRVLSAALPSEALAIAADPAQPLDLLLTDVVMPEMNGTALADRVRELRPSILVMFVSGYADDDEVRKRLGLPGVSFVQKPLTPEELGRRVREVIDGRH